jgi:CBS domain-containing protein
MDIAQVMTRDVKVASPDDTLQHAAELMCDIDAGVLPVGEDDRLVGMLTDRDICTRAVARGLSPLECKVRDVMSHDIKYIYEDATIEDAARNMGALQIRRLPVVNRAKRLVGIVSLGDLALKKTKAAGDALTGVSRH